MGKPVLKNENDVERWREIFKELTDQMAKDGLLPAEQVAIIGSWCDDITGRAE